ncbi:MAG TPA: winged helix-turn-helix domain-containing protein [Ilumatobacter sp.]|nr:winged helix-turn-helix domain-containing protein [Ilumatobacter sp.]
MQPAQPVTRLKPPGRRRARGRTRIARRRQRVTHDEVLTCGPLVLDVGAHQVLVAGEPVELSRLQLVILAELVRRAGRIVPTTELRQAAARVVVPTQRTVTSAVSRLRRYLTHDPGLPSIEHVPSRGYRLVTTPAAS